MKDADINNHSMQKSCDPQEKEFMRIAGISEKT